MPRYEAKIDGEDSWKEITDIEMMEELYKHFDRVTPAVKEMINGKEFRTSDAIYRLKWKGGDALATRSSG
jgi:hypothetical protein